MHGCQKKQSRNFDSKHSCGSLKLATLFFEWTEVTVQAIIIVVFLMTFVFRIVNVSGESMLNTLHDEDRVVITKWNYKPKNGDVVVIRHSKKLDFPIIKRIIALEGQKLEINFKDGSVKVDGLKIKEPYIKERMWLKGDAQIPLVIPKGCCFVMGDNRNNSTDSRFSEVGLISYEDIVGRASYIVFPFNRIGVI